MAQVSFRRIPEKTETIEIDGIAYRSVWIGMNVRINDGHRISITSPVMRRGQRYRIESIQKHSDSPIVEMTVSLQQAADEFCGRMWEVTAVFTSRRDGWSTHVLDGEHWKRFEMFRRTKFAAIVPHSAKLREI